MSNIYSVSYIRVKQAYVNGFISKDTTSRILNVLDHARLCMPMYVSKQYVTIMHDLCNIKISVNPAGLLVVSSNNLYVQSEPLIQQSMLHFIVDRILCSNILLSYESSILDNIVSDLTNLFVHLRADLFVCRQTLELLENYGIFWTGTRFSLLPKQSDLLDEYICVLPSNIRVQCLDLYNLITSINAKMPELVEYVRKLHKLTKGFWRNGKLPIQKLFAANRIFAYVLARINL